MYLLYNTIVGFIYAFVPRLRVVGRVVVQCDENGIIHKVCKTSSILYYVEYDDFPLTCGA